MNAIPEYADEIEQDFLSTLPTDAFLESKR
jgi:hypothetical protein